MIHWLSPRFRPDPSYVGPSDVHFMKDFSIVPFPFALALRIRDDNRRTDSFKLPSTLDLPLKYSPRMFIYSTESAKSE